MSVFSQGADILCWQERCINRERGSRNACRGGKNWTSSWQIHVCWLDGGYILLWITCQAALSQTVQTTHQPTDTLDGRTDDREVPSCSTNLTEPGISSHIGPCCCVYPTVLIVITGSCWAWKRGGLKTPNSSNPQKMSAWLHLCRHKNSRDSHWQERVLIYIYKKWERVCVCQLHEFSKEHLSVKYRIAEMQKSVVQWVCCAKNKMRYFSCKNVKTEVKIQDLQNQSSCSP